MQFFKNVMDVPVISQRQVPGAADDVYGGGCGVSAVLKGPSSAFHAIFRTLLRGVESQRSVVVVQINTQWVWTNTYV